MNVCWWRVASRFYACGTRPVASTSSIWASSSTATPRLSAFVSFDPAFAPATTKLVFFETEPVTLAPSAFSAAPASSRVRFSSVPVSTNVSPSSGCDSASDASTPVSSAARAAASLALSSSGNPAERKRSMTSRFSGTAKNCFTLAAIFGPMPSISAISSS